MSLETCLCILTFDSLDMLQGSTYTLQLTILTDMAHDIPMYSLNPLPASYTVKGIPLFMFDFRSIFYH